MGKEKSKGGAPNKAMHARISFLQQAATYLTSTSRSGLASNDGALASPATQVDLTANGSNPDKCEEPLTTQENHVQSTSTPSNHLSHPPALGSARLASHLTLIAQKSQIRLPSATKHQICKRCSSLLIEGSTGRKFVENLSKGGRKPHADVLVVECGVCGAKKRWPVGSRRQMKKGIRDGLKGEAQGDSTGLGLANVQVEDGTT